MLLCRLKIGSSHIHNAVAFSGWSRPITSSLVVNCKIGHVVIMRPEHKLWHGRKCHGAYKIVKGEVHRQNLRYSTRPNCRDITVQSGPFFNDDVLRHPVWERIATTSNAPIVDLPVAAGSSSPLRAGKGGGYCNLTLPDEFWSIHEHEICVGIL